MTSASSRPTHVRLAPVCFMDTTEPSPSKWTEVWAAAAAAATAYQDQSEQSPQETREDTSRTIQVPSKRVNRQTQPAQETREETSLEIHVSPEQVESTYLPRCPWLESAFLSAGSKILFAGWLVYSPNDTPVRNLPLRQDIVYMILLEDIPKIYLIRDKDQGMLLTTTTLDVSPKMRVELKDISKSHGRGVIVRAQDDGIIHGTILPISLPSYMFTNNCCCLLVDQDEFEELAHCTMAPFRRHDDVSTTPNYYSEWSQTEYHQEYAPIAQLEAAMHLLFVMDSWMTRMLFR